MAIDGKFRLLSLDGGGIRGLITAIWLERLEAILGGPIRDHVDMIAGTSTGAILACGVSHGIPATRLVELYKKRGREIFPAAPSRLWSRLGRTFSQGASAPRYSDAGIASVLRDEFEDTKFADLAIKPTLVTSYNTLTREAIVFKNTKAEHAELAVWELVKCSAAAPTFFPAHALRLGQGTAPFIDGGVVANNPTVCAIAEAVRQPEFTDQQNLVVLALGTGQTIRPIELDEARSWGALEWAVPIIDVLFDGAGDATEYVARHLIPDGRYFRLQTRLTAAYDDLDDASPSNLNALAVLAEDYLRLEGNAHLSKAAELLKQNPAP